ncbi:hypothetical protein [Sphingomonas crocodyli]|uniref:Uncharacterized protein n=1 Tax=Sphingomonas crocodyli TaxID=1979270 RepID=A0A437M6E1_9SPHN|nr:hypothetical protein [Sphingomonas crocodyli]RVT93242.1 hypothetical protein EOD43_04965 [Sphingomonas crocodyli]
MSVVVPLLNRPMGNALPRQMTDPIIAWAMVKEDIEELWIVGSDRDYHSMEDIPLGLVVLLSGWDSNDERGRDRVAQRWVEVAVRWRRQVAALTEFPIGLRTIFPGDYQGLADVRQSGRRLFLAI